MPRPLILRAALGLIRVSSWFVPGYARRAWRLEWEGEVRGRWDELEARRRVSMRLQLRLLGRAAGSIVDALMFRDVRWMMMGFGHDFVAAGRALKRHPVFALTVIATLGVGVGVTATIFSVAHDVLLRPFPYPDAERVVALHGFDVDGSRLAGNVTYPNVADLAEATDAFEGIAVARWWIPALDDGVASTVVRGATVTANFFGILGVEAGVGRLFREDEDGEGRPNQVVLSHALWIERFGGDPSVVGTDLRLSGASYTVLGVTAEGFEQPWILGSPGAEPLLWRTVASPPSDWPRSGRSWKGIARLREDRSLEAGQEQLDAAFAGLVEEFPEANANRGMRITPLQEVVGGPVRPVLLTLLGSVAVLLLIACANLANLMLGRALERVREVAVCRALGASDSRILGRSLAESLILAGAGGTLGLLIASGLGGLAGRFGSFLPRPISGDVDLAVVGFSLAVTAGCGLLCGLAPAIASVRVGRSSDRVAARGSTLGRDGRRLHRALVIGQLAMTTTLLVAAGLLGRTFQRLDRVDLGLRTEGVVGMQLHGSAWFDLSEDAAEAQWRAILTAVRAVPGVDAAGAIDYVPLSGEYSCDGVRRTDLPEPVAGEGQCAEVRVVLPGALEAMGVEVVRGRRLAESDGREAADVVVIDEQTAALLWPGRDPIGAEIHVHTKVHQVVGIVRDFKHFGPASETGPMLYLHGPQEGWNGIARGLSLMVRLDPDVAAVADVRRAVHGVNASIAIGTVDVLEGLRSGNLAPFRFRAGLMLAFGATALLLALLGVVGVMMYSVSRRTRELGLRVALGAQPAEVRRMVLAEGVVLLAGGLLLGMGGSLLLSSVIGSLLFGVTARDPQIYLGAVVVISVCGLGALYVPAMRASGVDPLRALQAE